MNILTILLGTFLAVVFINNDKDCSNAYSAADEAMSYASDCECDDAYSAADDSYSYAKKGYNSDSWDDTKTYAKKAMNSADDAMTYADDCTNE